jgi:WhiB family redox-sensing transcriptional regulator
MSGSSDWVESAACRGTDPDIFFPPRHQMATRARRICAGCTVSDDCLEAALREEDGFPLSIRASLGVRGGKTGTQRHDIAARRTLAAAVAS